MKHDLRPGSNGKVKMNCELGAHIIVESQTGIKLSPSLRAAEMFEMLPGVTPDEEIKPGDLFFFTRRGNTGEDSNPRRYHVAVFVGRDQNDRPILKHVHPGNHVSSWTLQRFGELDKYAAFMGVRRPIELP